MEVGLACPIPISRYSNVQMAHGGGGRLMHELIQDVFQSVFPSVQADTDAAVLSLPHAKLAFTTDSYVVQPLEFPGGTIGTLAVYGTVNDLATRGARPLALSTGYILEEGLPVERLQRIVRSMQEAADRAGVPIVTGDTKVVERARGDGLYVNTAGIGLIEHDLDLTPAAIRPGDAILVSGDLGRHGIAIMAVRDGLAFETEIQSDAAPLWTLVHTLLEGGITVRLLRDLTRGGLASALNEIATTARMDLTVDERRIPVQEEVRGACEMLGLDPLYVANEGRMVVFVPGTEADRALELMHSHLEGAGAALIGHVAPGTRGLVRLTSTLGVDRILDMLSGEQLPRIC